MSRVEVGEDDDCWRVEVDAKWVASFDNEAEAEAWAEAKRAEIAKARPYYVDGDRVRVHGSSVWAVCAYLGAMPSGTPQVWQRKLLGLNADLLNGGDLNDPWFKGVE